MTSSPTTDTRCLELRIANGLLLNADKMLTDSGSNMLASTSANVIALASFGVTNGGEQLLPGGMQLSGIGRLSNGISRDTIRSLDKSDLGFSDSGHQDLDAFAQTLSDGIALFDGNPEQELACTFSGDNAG